MNKTFAGRFIRCGLAGLFAGAVVLSGCSGENDSARGGAESDGDAVANKVFSPASEPAPTERHEAGVASPPQETSAPVVATPTEATAEQPEIAPDQPAAALRSGLKAKGWKEVKGEDGSILLMPPKSP